MLSRPLAFGLLAVACVVAAGGGAYVATLQHARSTSSSLSASPTGSQPQTSPQPIVASGAESATPLASQDAVASSGAPQPVVGPGAAPAAIVEPGPPPRKADRTVGQSRSPARQTPSASSPAGRTSAAPPPRGTLEPLVSPAAAPPSFVPVAQGVDPGSGQRPWPGPPASPPPASSGALPDLGGAAELEQAGHDHAAFWDEVVVPAESVLGLQLESSVSTESARVEDQVDARVTRDVRVGGHVAIPAGTRAIGTVVMVERGGRMRERARIGIRFNTLVFPDASRLPITTDTVYREGPSPANESSAKIGGAAIGGAIIGAILGGGRGAAIGSGIGAAGGAAAAMSGDRHPVFLAAGTTLSVRTQAPVTVTIEK
jgi:hypothetical protein